MSEKKNDLQFLIVVIAIIVGLAIGTSISAFQAVSHCIYSQDDAVRENCDLKNWQTLVLEGIAFVGAAGIIFFYLQRKSSIKTEKLIEEVGEYIRENKKLISTIKAGYLYSVQTLLYMAKEDFLREKTLADRDTDEAYRDRRIFMYVKGSREMHMRKVEQITSHVNFLKAYIDPATIDEIESAVKRIEHLCKDPKIPHFADVNSWLSRVTYNAEETDKLYAKLESLINENRESKA